MARTLGYRVTAKGVKSEEQLAFLRKQGCNELTARFLFQPPIERRPSRSPAVTALKPHAAWRDISSALQPAPISAAYNRRRSRSRQ